MQGKGRVHRVCSMADTIPLPFRLVLPLSWPLMPLFFPQLLFHRCEVSPCLVFRRARPFPTVPAPLPGSKPLINESKPQHSMRTHLPSDTQFPLGSVRSRTYVLFMFVRHVCGEDIELLLFLHTRLDGENHRKVVVERPSGHPAIRPSHGSAASANLVSKHGAAGCLMMVLRCARFVKAEHSSGRSMSNLTASSPLASLALSRVSTGVETRNILNSERSTKEKSFRLGTFHRTRVRRRFL